MKTENVIYTNFRISEKFIDVITRWHLLDWWRVKNIGLETGFAIESMDDRIRECVSPFMQKSLNDDFKKKINKWKREGWIQEANKGVHFGL